MRWWQPLVYLKALSFDWRTFIGYLRALDDSDFLRLQKSEFSWQTVHEAQYIAILRGFLSFHYGFVIVRRVGSCRYESAESIARTLAPNKF